MAMVPESRKLVTALLLTVLLGLAAVNVHAASHLSGDASDCKWCSSFSDVPTVNTIDDQALQSLPPVSLDVEFRQDFIFTAISRSFFARGPPDIN